MNLFEIQAAYQEALEALTDPEADIPIEAIADTLEGIEGMFNDKAVNVTKFIRNLEATAEAIKEAEEQMAKRRKAFESQAKRLRDYLKANMEAAGITNIKSPWFNLRIQKNPPAVKIVDERLIPSVFKAEIVTFKLDKASIKQTLEAGEEVPGAEMTQGTRLVVS
jgi:hypothetical protein